MRHSFSLVLLAGLLSLPISCSREGARAPGSAGAGGGAAERSPAAAADIQPPGEGGAGPEQPPPLEDATLGGRPEDERPPPAVDPVVAVLESLLADLAAGRVSAAQAPELEKRLVEVLARQGLGVPESRAQAAALMVRTMLDQMGASRGGGAALTPLQRQAMKALAEEMGRDLYRRLPLGGRGGGHTGVLLGVAREAELPPGHQRASWAVLGGFEYVEGRPLPPEATSLNGRKVGITGYMMTLEEVEDIHEFLLVESLWSCCFGIPPEVHQVVLIRVPGPRGVDFTTSPVLVLGTLEVGEEVEEGFVTSVYRLSAGAVREVD